MTPPRPPPCSDRSFIRALDVVHHYMRSSTSYFIAKPTHHHSLPSLHFSYFRSLIAAVFCFPVPLNLISQVLISFDCSESATLFRCIQNGKLYVEHIASLLHLSLKTKIIDIGDLRVFSNWPCCFRTRSRKEIFDQYLSMYTFFTRGIRGVQDYVIMWGRMSSSQRSRSVQPLTAAYEDRGYVPIDLFA